MTKATLHIYLLLSLLLNSLFSASVYAGNQTANISVNASFADCVDFTWGVKQILNEGEEVPSLNWAEDLTKMSMDFDKLWDPADPTYPNRLFSAYGYVVILWIAADEPYHVKQEKFESLYNRTTQDAKQNLDNSFIVIPEYDSGDKLASGEPQGVLGSNVLASSDLVKNFNDSNFLFYSKQAPYSRILRLQYCLPLNSSISNWQPIPTSQAPGQYQGSVTITVTPQS